MKRLIRKEILKKRDDIPREVKSKKNSLIKQKLFSQPEFVKAKSVFFYASFRSEVETLSMIKESIEMGKIAVLPKVDKNEHKLKLYEIKDVVELTPGYMGIPEPSQGDDRLVNIGEVDLVIIPGAAFDYSGNRLGYGGGYYDILLSESMKKIPIIALAYEEQIVDKIPSAAHDVKVDMIVTDKRVIKT